MMKNAVTLLLLLALLAAVAVWSPDPLYVRLAGAQTGPLETDPQQPGGGGVARTVADAGRDAYESAAHYAERAGQGVRAAGAAVADTLSGLTGAGKQKPACDEVGTEQRSLLDRATEAVTGREAEEVAATGSWQRAKGRAGEAGAAAAETAGHAKDAPLRRGGEAAEDASDESGSVVRRAGEQVSQGAGAARDAVAGAVGSARDAVAGAVGSARDAAVRAYDTVVEKGVQAADSAAAAGGAAYHRVGAVFDRDEAEDGGAGSAAAYREARERAGQALDVALEKVGSAYYVMYEAIEILAENVKAVPSRTAEYTSSATDSLGQATRSARDTVTQAGSGAYDAAASAGSTAYDTIKQVPDSLQGTADYVRAQMPDLSASGLRQRARDASQHLPNIGAGLSWPNNKQEEPTSLLDSLKQKLALGKSEEERRSVLAQFRDSLAGYSREERAGMMDGLLRKLGFYDPKEEQSLLDSLRAKLALGRTEEERKSVLERFRDSLPGGYTREEQQGVMERLLAKLPGYGRQEQQQSEGVLDSLKKKMTASS